MPAGRKTLMTEETVHVLESAFSNGATDLEACFMAGISKQTLYNYQEKYPEFVDRKEGLKNMIKFRAKQRIKEEIENEKGCETSKWYVERKGKDEGFSSRQEVTGANGKNLMEKDIDDTEFDKLMETYELNKRTENTNGSQGVE